MEHLELAVPTLFGLEGLCADELRRLGLSDVRAENGRVLCAARPADIPRVNLNLRTGERVLVLLGSFPAGDFDALITGDMNSAVEHRLVKYGDLPDIELLVVGHHGSKYSTSEELLLATRPELAVISTGYNTYGHPAPETLERLAAAGCGIYRTDWSGTVTVTAN